MLLFVQCLLACFIFTLLILPAQYKDPMSQLASYPPAIKRRVYELPQYRECAGQVERKSWKQKILGTLLMVVVLGGITYLSGKQTFSTAFLHVLILFTTVNLYDLVVLDWIIFCHSKKLMIPGTEDMTEEYKNPIHHLIGALKGCVIGGAVALLSAALVVVVGLLR